ncbi:MAG: glycosyltransferase [Prochloraceae cyanobacterium]|nr:glycosyltransferase [Prochloraceae cyanobacterium]
MISDRSQLEYNHFELLKIQNELEKEQAKSLSNQEQLNQRQSQLLEVQRQIGRSHDNENGGKTNKRSFWKMQEVFNKVKDLIDKTLVSLSQEGLRATLVKIKNKLIKTLGGKNLVNPNREILNYSQIETPKEIKLEISDRPVVSLIIPVYNKFTYTFNCLNSLKNRLNKSINFEIIIVDDASNDETEESLKKIAGIRVVRNQGNQGFIRSCNNGAAIAKGKFLCFLNNDTQILPGWLENLLLVIEKDKSVGAVGSKLIYPDGRLQEAGGVIWQDGSGWNYGRLDSPDEPEYNYLREVDYCSGASLLVRADLFQQLGGFSETYVPAYYEDTDLCFALRKLGYKVLYQPLSKVIHYEGISSGTSVTSGVKKYQEINKGKFQLKWQNELKQHLTPVAEQVELASRRLKKKPTILVIDSYVPLYDRESGSCRLFNLLKILLNIGYSIVFLPDNGFPQEPYTAELQGMGIEVLYCTSKQPDLEKQILKRLNFIELAWVCRPELCAKYLELIRANSNIPVIYDTIDLHFLRLKRQQEFLPQTSQDNSWQTYQELETKLARDTDATVVVTDVEKKTLNNLDIDNVWVIPNIHNSVANCHKTFAERSDLLFIGGYNHVPNVDAVVWLCREIMPIIWQSQPDMKVTLLGSNPPQEVKTLESDRVRVTGYVKDVEPYFLNSRVFVAPLRFGAGMKGKIGHSMSYGLPTVTTSIGAEGMGLTHGYDVMIAEDPESLANCVMELYDNDRLWNRISDNALETVRLYSPENIEEQLTNLVENLVK